MTNKVKIDICLLFLLKFENFKYKKDETKIQLENNFIMKLWNESMIHRQCKVFFFRRFSLKSVFWKWRWKINFLEFLVVSRIKRRTVISTKNEETVQCIILLTVH